MSPFCEICEKRFTEPNRTDHVADCIICGQECCKDCIDESRICKECSGRPKNIYTCPFCQAQADMPGINEGNVVQCYACGERARMPGHQTAKREEFGPAFEQYKLELPGGSVEILAANDIDARVKAKDYLREHGSVVLPRGVRLYRYPKDWVTRGGELTEVQFTI